MGTDRAIAPKTIVLITRPEPGATRFEQMIKERSGLATCVAPLQKITALGLAQLDDVAGLILTSQSGLLGLSAATNLPVWCVGRQTTEAAKAAGLQAIYAGGSATELKQHLIEFAPKGLILHLRGVHTTGDLAAELTQEGIATKAEVVYDQVACALSHKALELLQGHIRVILPLFSARSARLTEPHVREARADVVPVAISQTVASVLGSYCQLPVQLAVRPDAEAMVEGCLRAAGD